MLFLASDLCTCVEDPVSIVLHALNDFILRRLEYLLRDNLIAKVLRASRQVITQHYFHVC